MTTKVLYTAFESYMEKHTRGIIHHLSYRASRAMLEVDYSSHAGRVVITKLYTDHFGDTRYSHQLARCNSEVTRTIVFNKSVPQL